MKIPTIPFTYSSKIIVPHISELRLSNKLCTDATVYLTLDAGAIVEQHEMEYFVLKQKTPFYAV